jgi:hypothetical protein
LVVGAWSIVVLALMGAGQMWWNYYRELHPDADVLREQRRLYADGGFRRHWTGRKPQDLDCDRLQLECGHWMYWGHKRPLPPDDLVECDDCARRFLRKSSKSLRKSR